MREIKKTLEISKTFKKKAAIFNKDKLKEVLNRPDITLYLDKESHWTNGESEFVFTMHIQDNHN